MKNKIFHNICELPLIPAGIGSKLSIYSASTQHPKTSLYGPILVETSRTIIRPRQYVSGFLLILDLQCLIYTWYQEI